MSVVRPKIIRPREALPRRGDAALALFLVFRFPPETRWGPRQLARLKRILVDAGMRLGDYSYAAGVLVRRALRSSPIREA